MKKTSSAGPLLLGWTFLVFFANQSSADCGNASTATTSTINNAADAAALASACPTFFGDVVLAANSTGDINLDGLVNLTGDVTPSDSYGNFTGTQITSFRSKSLTSIGSGLALYTAPLLEYISLPGLQSVNGNIYIGDAPLLTSIDLSSAQTLGTWVRIFVAWNLTDLKFPTNANGGRTINGIEISETALKDMSGFTSTPADVYFANNPFLEEVTVDVSETTGNFQDPGDSWDRTGVVVATNNSAAVNVSLPNLSVTAGYIMLDNCSALSIPALSSINGSFTMQNASFKSLEAPNLGLINGTLNITGSFTRISAFPALSRVAGDVYIQSTEYIDCAPFEQLSADAKIGGNIFFCQGASSPAAGSPTASPLSSASASSSSSSLSTGAKAGIGVGVAVGALLIFGGVLAFYFRKRRQTRSPAPVVDPTLTRAEVAGSTRYKAPVLNEVEGGYPWQELSG